MARMMLIVAAVLLAASALSAPAAAKSPGAAPSLSLPIACTMHVDCWIAKYFDSDPGPGARDYTGGSRTNNGHNGTDFAIRDLAAMARGVAVLAAADGVVHALRDGMEDVNIKSVGTEAVGGRECGNGVLIDHAPGWATQYCHLRKDSVRVKTGQRVTAGDVIGLVGQSGLAEFPHVHLNVLHDGKRIDPFSPDGDSGAGLWTASAQTALQYRPVSVYASGFRQAVPEREQVALGNIEDQALSPTSPVILLWSGLYGMRAGDAIKQTIVGPDGAVLVERETVQEKDQIRRFSWIGKKLRSAAWPLGEYIGRTIVTPRPGSGYLPFVLETKTTIAARSAN